MASGDFNEDGNLDLVVTLRFSNVAVILGKGNGFFSEPYSMDVKGQPTAVLVGDYDKDGKADVAVALAGNGNKGVQVLWGKGDGKFEGSKAFKGGKQPLSLVSLDVNNDGLMEFVTSSNSLHALTTLINNGDKTFNSLRDFASGNFPKFVVRIFSIWTSDIYAMLEEKGLTIIPFAILISINIFTFNIEHEANFAFAIFIIHF